MSCSVVLPLTMWIEWLVCVPLMAFVSVYTDDSADFTWYEYSLIFSLACCIIFGFVMSQAKLQAVYFSFLALSILSFLVAARLAYVNLRRNSHRYVLCSENETGMSNQRRKVIFDVTRNTKLANLLIFVLPSFPLIYMLAMTHVISREASYVGLVIANFNSKWIFLSQACDMQVGLVDKLIALLLAEISANDSRREFLRYVFHEVRVPLNSLMLGLDVISQNVLNDSGNDAVLIMKESANFMADTLDGVLSMHQIEEGKMELSCIPFSVRPMLERAVATVQGSANTKCITVTVDISDDIPRAVIGDKFRLEHVVANLLSNAIKFTPKDKSIAVVAMRKQPCNAAGVCMVIISVIDEGPGIAPADLEHLFSFFHEVQPNELQKGGGSGLGLSLAHSIVKLHGGQLTCESRLGQGTTFTVELPLQISEEDASPKSTSGRGLKRDSVEANRSAEADWRAELRSASMVEADLKAAEKVDIRSAPSVDVDKAIENFLTVTGYRHSHRLMDAATKVQTPAYSGVRTFLVVDGNV